MRSVYELRFSCSSLPRVYTRQISEFLFMLALLLEAGLAFSETSPKAVAGIKNTALRECFKPAQAWLGIGSSVAETLAKVPVLKPMTLQIIAGSEHSGKLAGGMAAVIGLFGHCRLDGLFPTFRTPTPQNPIKLSLSSQTRHYAW